MLRLSSFVSRNWNEEVLPITLSPGNCDRAVIRSSDSPSEKYCWLASALSFANGSTAMECGGGVREADGVTPAGTACVVGADAECLEVDGLSMAI